MALLSAQRKSVTLAPALPIRFWSKVNKTDTCWLWTACTYQGYGIFNLNGRARRAHRLAYAEARGAIPDGLVLDHLCRTPACVNPDHLEAVHQGENMRRGLAPEVIHRFNAARTGCDNGHPYLEGSYRLDHKGHRKCIECQRAKWRREHHASKKRGRKRGSTIGAA